MCGGGGGVQGLVLLVCLCKSQAVTITAVKELLFERNGGSGDGGGGGQGGGGMQGLVLLVCLCKSQAVTITAVKELLFERNGGSGDGGGGGQGGGGGGDARADVAGLSLQKSVNITTVNQLLFGGVCGGGGGGGVQGLVLLVFLCKSQTVTIATVNPSHRKTEKFLVFCFSFSFIVCCFNRGLS